MLADLLGSLLAVSLFPLFIVAPGFAVAWLADLFDFRRRTAAFQLALSIPLSIALCPVATYLTGRFASMNAVWVLYTATGIYALVVATPKLRGGVRLPRAAIWLFGVWTLLAMLSLVDLQMGNRIWFPAAAFDYSVRTQFIHSLATVGIPPSNPFYFPGHPVPLRYHYFWLLLCSLVKSAGGAAVSPRQAWIGGVVWCGVGLMAVVALYLRLLWYRGPATFPKRAVTGILLLGVTGLDILPTALLWLAQAAGMRGVLPSGEWWNEQVDGFFYSTLWESHYVSGLIASLTAFLILWHAPRQQTLGARLRYALIGGVAVASAGGSSVYVGFVFALFLAVWSARAIALRQWRDVTTLVIAGTVGACLLVPFALSLRDAAPGRPLLEFWIRPFYPVDALFKGQSLGKGWSLPVANALSLPLNYFLELGFFFAAALHWWKRHRASGAPLTSAQAALALMITTSVLTCTFLRSSVIGNNDLGWRGFLFAQFGLLLWAVDVIGDWRVDTARGQRAFWTALLMLGAAGSIYELFINRCYPLLADRGTVATLSWLAPDRHAGERTYAYREAGEWAAASTAPTATVQYNPRVAIQNTAAYLYADRQMVAADNSCMSTFGGDPAACGGMLGILDGIYGTGAASLDAVCHALPVDVLAAADTDAVWADRQSWVWTGKPAFVNRYLRLFRCPVARDTASRAPQSEPRPGVVGLGDEWQSLSAARQPLPHGRGSD